MPKWFYKYSHWIQTPKMNQKKDIHVSMPWVDTNFAVHVPGYGHMYCKVCIPRVAWIHEFIFFGYSRVFVSHVGMYVILHVANIGTQKITKMHPFCVVINNIWDTFFLSCKWSCVHTHHFFSIVYLNFFTLNTGFYLRINVRY